jgi:hypothetical protein
MNLHRPGLMAAFPLVLLAPSARSAWIPDFSAPQTIMSAPGAPPSYGHPSLSVDDQGTWHICYVYNGSTLRYQREGSEPVDLISAPLTGQPDIAAGASDHVVIVYCENEAQLKLLERTSQGWTSPQTILSAPANAMVSSPSVALDPSGHWQLAYLYEAPMGGVSLYYRTSTTEAELIDTWAALNIDWEGPSLDVDASGTPVLASMGSPTPDRIVLRSRTISGWTSPVVVVPPQNGFASIGRPSLAAVSAGDWSLAYLGDTSVTYTCYIRYCQTGTGSITLAKGDHPVNDPGPASIDLGTNGETYLVYMPGGGGSQKYYLQYQCFRGGHRTPYGSPFAPSCCPPDPDDPDCAILEPPASPQTAEDEDHDQLILSCEDSNYFCLKYKPHDGPAVMISKCPWCGGRNNIRTWGIPGSDPRIPKRWVEIEHVSYDFRSLLLPAYGYCDDWPLTDISNGGPYDWVIQQYSPCRNIMTVTHCYSPDGMPGDHYVDKYSGPPGSQACDFTAFFPTYVGDPSCCGTQGAQVTSTIPGDAARDSIVFSMGPVSSRLSLSGAPLGGSIVLAVLGHGITVTTTHGESLDEIAAALALAVTSSPDLQAAGVVAQSSGPALSLYNVQYDQISMVVSDEGINHPAPPRNATWSVQDTTIVVSWVNGEQYDRVFVEKSGRLLMAAMDAESVVDTLPWRDPQGYSVVGWKNGVPSAAAIADSTAVTGIPLEPRDGLNELFLTTRPNPSSRGTIISYTLPHATFVRVTIHGITGTRLADLTEEFQEPGPHTALWDGIGSGNGKVPAGIYFVRLDAGGRVASAKIVLTR